MAAPVGGRGGAVSHYTAEDGERAAVVASDLRQIGCRARQAVLPRRLGWHRHSNGTGLLLRAHKPPSEVRRRCRPRTYPADVGDSVGDGH